MTHPSSRSFPRLSLGIVAIAMLWVVGSVSFAVWKTPEVQLATMPLFFAYVAAAIASLVLLMRKWRRIGWRAAIPLLACIAAWHGARIARDAAGDALFARNLPVYESVVMRPEVQALAPGAELQELPLRDAERADLWWAAAERTPDGTLLVELLNGRGFPVKHSGFLYSSSGRIPTDSRMAGHWSYRCTMRPHWFCVSD